MDWKKLNRFAFALPPGRVIGRRIYAARRKAQAPTQTITTRFFRHLSQLGVLQGPLRPIAQQPSLRVLVVGCSTGCEAYTVAAFLAEHFPRVDWSILGLDVSEEALRIATRSLYGPKYGLGSTDPDLSALERQLFEGSPRKWQVRDDIRARVTFAPGNVLSPDFPRDGAYDIVFGQNFMIHMSAEEEALAFANLVAATRSGGVLFVQGMNLDRRAQLVARHKLKPVDWNVAAIHEADDIRRAAWPWKYWSLEPLGRRRDGFLERYSTIFVKP